MSSKKNNLLVEQLKKQIQAYKTEVTAEKVGTIVEVGDGIARIAGLSECMALEMLDFGNDVYGLALNLEEDSVGAIILGDCLRLKQGDMVKTTGRILEVPVGPGVIGRVVNPLGMVLDGKDEIKTDIFYPVEKIAPRVIARAPVNTALQTGIKSIDAMIPIGRGQRELIIGDRQTGKTAIAIDTIINQKGQDVICVYVAVGQKESKIARIVAELEKRGAMEYTTIVLAGASDPAAMSYIAPYAGCAMAEYFMDQGRDVLVVYDDLSKHAVAYRELSLLLRRPPGREAYPGDIFYLHSRLLERAAKLSKENGGGSITALPIIETQAGDVSAYIPTNVISITDGQVYLEPDLFYKGIRPAISTGLSVSRVGSSAQIKAMKKVAGKLKMQMAQFRELESFSQFGSDLDTATKEQLELGLRIQELLKQNEYSPMPVAEQVAIIFAAVRGHLNDIVVDKIKDFEKEFLEYLNKVGKDTLQKIVTEKELSAKLEKELTAHLENFKKTIDYQIKPQVKEKK